MRSLPLTIHFWVAQLGLQLWFRKRERFPFFVASMICNRQLVRGWGEEEERERKRYLVLLQCHKVIVPMAVSGVFLGSLLELALI